MKELEEENRNLAVILSDQEKLEFAMDKFTSMKVKIIEDRINGKFKMVKWKMFETQINGGIVDACEATYLGVPYSSLNQAAQMNCGIDIINGLCENYGVYAPIFCDRSESVNEVIPTKSQLIKLIVTHDPQLTIK